MRKENSDTLYIMVRGERGWKKHEIWKIFCQKYNPPVSVLSYWGKDSDPDICWALQFSGIHNIPYSWLSLLYILTMASKEICSSQKTMTLQTHYTQTSSHKNLRKFLMSMLPRLALDCAALTNWHLQLYFNIKNSKISRFRREPCERDPPFAVFLFKKMSTSNFISSCGYLVAKS